jgi:hypothetical protein
LIDDIAMEPGGRVLAWLGVDGTQFLRSFDGVPPGAAGAPGPGPGPAASPAPGSPPAAPGAPRILPIVPKRFVLLRPIDPKELAVTATCTADDLQSGDCRMKLAMYYRLTGKQGTIAAAPRRGRLVRLGAASATLKPGTRRKLKLRLTRDGRRVVARGRKVAVLLDVTVTRGAQTATSRLSTTLRAKRR